MFKLISIILKAFLLNQRLLIILQNNNEIRPTGGFITSTASISFLKIKFLNVFTDLQCSKKIKGPTPLMNLLHHGNLNAWSFRDANFDPDFTKSAKQIIKFYNIEYPSHKIHSLIAINFTFFEKILKIIGPISIKKQSINSQNLFYFLSASVSDIDRHSLHDLQNRKNILKSLAKKILLNVITKPYLIAKYSKLVNSSYTSRSIQIFQSNKSTNQFKAAPGQVFFSINECNCLGLKSNRYIKKTIFHDSEINDKNILTEKIRIIWEHLGEYDFPLSGNYHAYIRIFLNKNFKIQEIDLFPQQSKPNVNNYGNLQYIDFNLALPPKQKFIFNIIASRKQPSSNYQFHHFHQSGSQNEHLHKTITFPQTYRLASTDPSLLIKENTATLDQANISKDTKFNLQVTEKNIPPRIISHEIYSHNIITVEFSSPPKEKITKNHITVFQKETHKQLSIDSIKIEKNTLQIKTTNMPKTKELFYSVHIQNALYPKGRQITVVYRPQFFY